VKRLYFARWLPPSSVNYEQRIRDVERDLARLEGIVESLGKSVAAEHETVRQARVEDRKSIKELGERMEKVVEELAKEIRSVAKAGQAQGEEIATQKAVLNNTADLSKWLLASVVSITGLFVAYAALQRAHHSAQDPNSGYSKPYHAPATQKPYAPLP
jgi:uncharacterized coiled-coil protein SlyX